LNASNLVSVLFLFLECRDKACLVSTDARADAHNEKIIAHNTRCLFRVLISLDVCAPAFQVTPPESGSRGGILFL